jgi:hypothetical protein
MLFPRGEYAVMMIFFSLPTGQLDLINGGKRTVLKQFRLDQRRMAFNLVHGRNDPSLLDDLLQHLDGKVGNSNSFDLFSLLRDPNHFLPSSSNPRSIKINSLGSIFIVWGKLFSGLESNGPVDEIDV